MFKKTFCNFLHISTRYRSSPLPKLFKILLIVYFAILISESSVQAHSGGTDSNGGHNNTSTGEYHYHHGHSAHQHLNGICPYENTSQTYSNSNTSSDSDRYKSFNSYKSSSSDSNISSSSNSESDSNSNQEFMIFISLAGGVSIFYFLKVRHDKIKKKQQFEREKLYFSNQYKGKSIYELANVPENINFDENDLPISVDDSGLKWGKEFTVYVSKHGKCYHRNCGCSGAYNRVHIFNEVKRFRAIGCRRCSSGERFIIPEWYDKYLEIKKIKNRYDI